MKMLNIGSKIGKSINVIKSDIIRFRMNFIFPKFHRYFSHPIRPSKFEKILLHFLNEPLEDISISRPSDRVNWAIPVPNDESQTIYVWLDALVNYLTSANYPHADVSIHRLIHSHNIFK